MKISGLQKLTLLDYPGHLAAIVFLPGCNFRCPFCQNSSLVLKPGEEPEITKDELMGFLQKRSGILEGVCVTGGEPTLHPDLPELLASIRSAGYLVKLDTNGTNPDMLQSLLQNGLVDYAAMDIKAGPENYHRVCGLKSDDILPEKINRSINLLKSSSIDYEFRTTVVRGLHTEQDFIEIADWIAGSKAYFLQSFRDCPEVLLKNHTFSAFSEDEMNHFLELVREKVPTAELRGM